MRIRPRFTIRIGDSQVRLGERTLIVGILNVTPDSFSDGGLYFDPALAVRHAMELVGAGADWIDVGGESTRPGSRQVSAKEESRRVLPVIRALRQKLASVPISIDTTKAEVAEQALTAGASIVNDVSGLRFDARIADAVRRHSAALILMHLHGRPETMQRRPFARDIWRSMRDGLGISVRKALRARVKRSQLIIDPGLGFGKSRRQNYAILANLERLQSFQLPILAGSSRKSFVQAVVRGEGLDARSEKGRGRPAPELWPLAPAHAADAVHPALEFGDAAAVVAAILAGAHIVRVHNVASLTPAVRVADALLAARK